MLSTSFARGSFAWAVQGLNLGVGGVDGIPQLFSNKTNLFLDECPTMSDGIEQPLIVR